jgi:predicted nucleic acid-binding protein
MIILDTNVVSEFVRPVPHPEVVRWLDRHLLVDVWTTAITAGELAAGIAELPVGRRRSKLRDVVQRQLTIALEGMILPFDLGSADHYAGVLDRRRRAGRPIDRLDAQIAAICLQHDAVLATRNVKDFVGTGVELINPWDA